MKKNNEKGTESKIVEVNGFSQTMDEADYSLVEQYMLDQIEEEQMLEAQATEDGEDKSYTIAGTKHPLKDKISWTK